MTQRTDAKPRKTRGSKTRFKWAGMPGQKIVIDVQQQGVIRLESTGRAAVRVDRPIKWVGMPGQNIVIDVQQRGVIRVESTGRAAVRVDRPNSLE